MAEFIDGFDFLSNFERTVTFFGSARLNPDHPASRKARELARLLAEAGCTVITGGGPGIMEAANRGAREAGAESIGLNIELPLEQRINPYINRGMGFHYFFTRKVMLAFSAEAYVFFPGGLGTLDEFSELATLLQTHKIEEEIPIILMGSDFWQPLLDWIHQTMYKDYRAIDARDEKLWTVTDSVEEAFTIIRKALPRKRIKLQHRS
ncbi:TIGR00730 family Rossman fold protein [Candidatus Berkelbacteria bacterium]|nr:TIGR00730 family Rossman fold protein [Candidatus Berkelbacteria bacterium]